VPIQCEYYALEGLGALRRNVDLVRANLNPTLAITGFVLTMLDARTRLSQQVVEEVKRHFGDLVFRTTVPRSVRLAEAPSFGSRSPCSTPGRGAPWPTAASPASCSSASTGTPHDPHDHRP
jgi:chromosome partitioning protein